MDIIEKSFVENDWTVDAVGKQFLVMFVSKNGEQYEIANFRKDVGFSDGRRPDEAVIGDLTTDAARRDFTVNSIYYDPFNGSFLDPNKGLKDIETRTLRFIGRPHDRIKEDYLRIFRFYRFLSKGFTPDKRSLKACRELFNEAYGQTTPERVRMEIERIVL
jgi:poly(A) polymerase